MSFFLPFFFFGNYLFSSLAHLLIRIFGVLFVNLLVEVLCIFSTPGSVWSAVNKGFLPCCRLPLCSDDGCLCWEEALELHGTSFTNSWGYFLLLKFFLESSYLYKYLKYFLRIVSSLVLVLKYLINFELLLLWSRGELLTLISSFNMWLSYLSTRV